jgi:hypothetical protein
VGAKKATLRNECVSAYIQDEQIKEDAVPWFMGKHVRIGSVATGAEQVGTWMNCTELENDDPGVDHTCGRLSNYDRKANVIALSFLLVREQPANMSVNPQATRVRYLGKAQNGQAALEGHQRE